MANFRRRNLRVALVACAPPLARIHERLFRALGIRESGTPGSPGGSCVFLSDDVGELEAYALSYFASEWLSKLDDGKPSPAKKALTWERFHLAEKSCFDINQRSKREWAESPWSQEIRLATKLISKILGKFDWDQAARGFGWGPGATTRLTRRKADAAHKYCGTPHSTIGNAILANAVIASIPLWQEHLPKLSEEEGVGCVKIVPGNRIITVPKNWKTERTIAIEPDMNTYVQQGLGSLIRDRLGRVGLNLNDQTRNQRLARVGSAAGTLATIDLSMASDTLSRSLVELLLPPEWSDALGQCRSPFGVLPSGEKIFYQKFSSMGNSYTFELETLIFYALALSVCRLMGEEVNRVSVYGDDIVVPSAAAERLMGLLSFVGFTPNEKKSYYTGPFRESCGKHYFLGHDITPFYVKKHPKTLMDLFKVHNQIVRYLNTMRWLSYEQRINLRKVCSWLRGFSPAAWRKPRLVDGLGDGAFIGSFDEVVPNRGPRGWDGYVFDTFVAQPAKEDFDSPSLLVKALDRLEGNVAGNLSQNIRDKELVYISLSQDEAWQASVTRLLKELCDELEVLPQQGARYVPTRIFIASGYVHRQCALL